MFVSRRRKYRKCRERKKLSSTCVGAIVNVRRGSGNAVFCENNERKCLETARRQNHVIVFATNDRPRASAGASWRPCRRRRAFLSNIKRKLWYLEEVNATSGVRQASALVADILINVIPIVGVISFRRSRETTAGFEI